MMKSDTSQLIWRLKQKLSTRETSDAYPGLQHVAQVEGTKKNPTTAIAKMMWGSMCELSQRFAASGKQRRNGMVYQ